MKIVLSVAAFVLVIAGCQKNVVIEEKPVSESISSDALQPFPCHSTSFQTDYPIKSGKVPPFRFTKSLYSDTRVKSINMLSRANPIHAQYKPQAWELTGTFSYAKNSATFTGTKELWEYFTTSTGATGKKSVVKKDVSLHFAIREDGACYYVYNNLKQQVALRILDVFPGIDVQVGSDEPVVHYYLDPSAPDSQMVISCDPGDKRLMKTITFTYTDNISNYLSYQPTQNWISLEFTILEVMQWLPGILNPSRERSKVAVEFYANETLEKVVQSQVYKNHQYGMNGNLQSYTYGDNILQKTTWYCK